MNNLFVFDTNSLVSAALLPVSISRQALDKALRLGKIAVSGAVIEKLIEVLFRKKFDRYFLSDDERWAVIEKVERNAKGFIPVIKIADCCDPKDNKYLELAVAANASCIIAGDKDLLVLHPFRSIPILNAADFVNEFSMSL